MIRPKLGDIKPLQKEYTIIPVSMEMLSDIKTPIEVLKKLREKSKKCYLLESVEGGEKWGRYSFLGYDPQMVLRCNQGVVTNQNETISKTLEGHPSKVLEKLLSEYKPPHFDYLPPFTGGFVGYFSYDYIAYNESSLSLTKNDLVGMDDFQLMLFEKVIVFDHLRQKIILIINIHTEDIEKNYKSAMEELFQTAQMIRENSVPDSEPSRMRSDFKPLFSKQEYCRMVEKIQSHILEGDIFQAVLSNRLEAEFEGNLLNTYRVLRTINPSPYMFYISCDDLEIAGASPETLLSLVDGNLSTFPIAGTCPRGKTEEEDARLIAELLRDEKELSEHNMLVDLGRNDIGRVSEFGSVHVSDYQKVLKFSHVSHISTKVEGRLKKGLTPLDAVAAVLPAGTLSGAPKIRACQIIDSLESHKRGIYGGAIGYIGFSGNMDLCIAIRMAFKKKNKVYVQAGAGIVADSIPEKEYMECLNKANAMTNALIQSGEVK